MFDLPELKKDEAFIFTVYDVAIGQSVSDVFVSDNERIALYGFKSFMSQISDALPKCNYQLKCIGIFNRKKLTLKNYFKLLARGEDIINIIDTLEAQE